MASCLHAIKSLTKHKCIEVYLKNKEFTIYIMKLNDQTDRLLQTNCVAFTAVSAA